MNRVMTALHDLAERLGKVERQTYVHSETFQSAAVALAPLIAEARDGTKRGMLRDFLLHAATTPPDDPTWDEAELAMRLLREIDAPGLAMVAAAGRLGATRLVVRSDDGTYAGAPGPASPMSAIYTALTPCCALVSPSGSSLVVVIP